MKQVTVMIEGRTTYSQSRKHNTPKLERESDDAYETRTWLERCTTNREGQIVIPAMAFKQCLDAAARLHSEKIPGMGNNTYTKHFLSGCVCLEDVPIFVEFEKKQKDGETAFVPRGIIYKEDTKWTDKNWKSKLKPHDAVVKGVTISVSPTGERGSRAKKRVDRTFPIILPWVCAIPFVIFDDTITKAVFERTIREGGQFVGVGRFRLENGGIYGRFDVLGFEWTQDDSVVEVAEEEEQQAAE